jgi:hypothetical protein
MAIKLRRGEGVEHALPVIDETINTLNRYIETSLEEQARTREDTGDPFVACPWDGAPDW